MSIVLLHGAAYNVGYHHRKLRANAHEAQQGVVRVAGLLCWKSGLQLRSCSGSGSEVSAWRRQRRGKSGRYGKCCPRQGGLVGPVRHGSACSERRGGGGEPGWPGPPRFRLL
jgi:hypothetical protein